MFDEIRGSHKHVPLVYFTFAVHTEPCFFFLSQLNYILYAFSVVIIGSHW